MDKEVYLFDYYYLLLFTHFCISIGVFFFLSIHEKLSSETTKAGKGSILPVECG